MKRLLKLARSWTYDLWDRLFAKRYIGFDCAGNGDYMTFVTAYKTNDGKVVITEIKSMEAPNESRG